MATTVNGHGLGMLPSPKDDRDYLYTDKMAAAPAKPLPSSVDLRNYLPSVFDQGQIASCTGNAISAAVAYERTRQGLKPDFIPSRMLIYCYERLLEGTLADDAGAYIRDGMKVVQRYGVTGEDKWSHDAQHLPIVPDPVRDANVIFSAAHHKAIHYYALPEANVDAVKHALAFGGPHYQGTPVVFGWQLDGSFNTAYHNGIYPPDMGVGIGGHAMLIVGFDSNLDCRPAGWTSSGAWLVRNSWGGQWPFYRLPNGQETLAPPDMAGHFWLPWERWLVTGDIFDRFVLDLEG